MQVKRRPTDAHPTCIWGNVQQFFGTHFTCHWGHEGKHKPTAGALVVLPLAVFAVFVRRNSRGWGVGMTE